MKYSEVTKALEENPSKKFEFTDCGTRFEMSVQDHYYHFDSYDENGKKHPWDVGIGGFSGNITLHTDWKEVEVRHYLTYAKAFEKWLNGKTVYCELDGHISEYDGDYALFRDEIGFAVSKSEVRSGKWWVEE